MIIKQVNIINFASIKNKVINFKEGVNVVYGLNEAGKSTIQAFIKIWLYGFSSYRGKDVELNERKRYGAVDGSNISGQLHVVFKGNEYIISRSFGKSKKEDTSKIVNAITGEEVYNISKYEPGKSFFNINRSTFTKTLFIGQLDVQVKKDKDEEIIDKISSSVGVGQGEVGIEKAILKLDTYKKGLCNSKKTGELDLLKKNYADLINERYNAYKQSDRNLENEQLLIILNSEKNKLITELDNLDIYKRYVKKVKLQKQYKEISEYLIRKQNLELQEQVITSDLTFNDEVVDNNYIDDIKEEYKEYLKVTNEKEEKNKLVDNKIRELATMREQLSKYKYLEQLGDEFLSNLESLKIKQQVLKEKVDLNIKLDNEINILIKKQEEVKRYIGNGYKIEFIKESVEDTINDYEEKLKRLKGLIENKKENKFKNISFKIILALITLMSLVISLIANSKSLKGAFYIISIVLVVSFIFLLIKDSKIKQRNNIIKKLKNDIVKIEEQIKEFMKNLDVETYEEFIKKLKLYYDYISLKDKIDNKIKEKNIQKELLNLLDATKEYYKNNNIINNCLNFSNRNSLEEIIKDYRLYTNYKNQFDLFKDKVKNLISIYNRLCDEVIILEERIRRKLEKINLSNTNLEDLEQILNNISYKIEERREIKQNLKLINETYSILTKDKDIEVIKEEVKNIVSIKTEYSYNTEEEIDLVLKEKNLKLIDIEKKIKDMEHSINNRFKFSRTISEIEEEIAKVEEEIVKNEKYIKAIDIARENLQKSYDEIRSSFGPLLNEAVKKYFTELTKHKYKEVMVSDKYEIKIKGNNNIFSSKVLSNGAKDQLYLALRLAFIKMIFNTKNVSIFLDDAFTQYDDERVGIILSSLYSEGFTQSIIFTCQKREGLILTEKNIDYNYIQL